MRVLFTVSDWATHYFPMVPLGWALQAAGHEVRVGCRPSQADTIATAGLVPLPVLDGPDLMFKTRLARYWQAAADPGSVMPDSLLHPVSGEVMDGPAGFDFPAYAAAHRQSNLDMMSASCDRVVDFARRWRPDLTVSDPQNVEGVLAAQVLGVPAVCHLFGMVGTHETGPGLNIVLEDHSDSFARYRVPPMSADLIDYVVDPCPAGTTPEVGCPTLPVRYIPYNGPGEMPSWLDDPPASGVPRILVAWGTSVPRIYGPRAFLVPMLLAALSEVDAEVVVTAAPSDRAKLGTLPDNVRLVHHWCPLRLMLPTCAAIVHPGGAGTTMTATMLGVPQLVLPLSAETAMNARRAASTGAALDIDGWSVSPDQVRAGLSTVLSGAARDAARELAGLARQRPTPAQLVGTLVAVAADRRPSVPALAALSRRS